MGKKVTDLTDRWRYSHGKLVLIHTPYRQRILEIHIAGTTVVSECHTFIPDGQSCIDGTLTEMLVAFVDQW